MVNEQVIHNYLKSDSAMTLPVSKEQYRLEQEAFVSNNEGMKAGEVILALLFSATCSSFSATILAAFKKYINKNVKVVIEFTLIVIPIILSYTVLSENIREVGLLMLTLNALFLLLICVNNRFYFKRDFIPRSVTGRIPIVTNFRALTNIITVFCILAVDFRIFPRRFAKTEAFGYSLMDTGVGLFIIANALVAPEARDFSGSRKAGSLEALTRDMKNCFQSCVPLLVLGCTRMLAIEYIGYQKHVTEYGVHWNFFLTLAIVKLFACMFISVSNSKYLVALGLWVLFIYEYTLNSECSKWILQDGPRDNIFSANREGLISIPGYVGLYFIGVAIGRLIHSTYKNSHSKSNMYVACGSVFKLRYDGNVLMLFKLLLINTLIFFLLLYCNFKISRRFFNIGYCFWIIYLATQALFSLLYIELGLDVIECCLTNKSHIKNVTEKNLEEHERVGSEEKENERIVSRSFEIFDAVNYNGLFFFLLGNVMTGLVNISIYTLYVSDLVALLILIIYMSVNILSVLILYRLKISINRIMHVKLF